jgi:uroporphyrinogen III methyltransferase / synthase
MSTPIANRKTPLYGKRIVVTRSPEQGIALSKVLQEKGAIPVVVPTIEIVPIGSALKHSAIATKLNQYDWILFTSANTVNIFFQQICDDFPKLLKTLQDGQIQVAAVGRKTAAALDQYRIAVSYLPTSATITTLAGELPLSTSSSILLPQGNLADDQVANLLRQRGAKVDLVVLYTTVSLQLPDAIGAEFEAGVDAITFTSGSTATSFLTQLCDLYPQHGRQLHSTPLVCIGPVTAHAVRQLGFQNPIVADEPSIEGMVETLYQLFQSRTAHEQPQSTSAN